MARAGWLVVGVLAMLVFTPMMMTAMIRVFAVQTVQPRVQEKFEDVSSAIGRPVDEIETSTTPRARRPEHPTERAFREHAERVNGPVLSKAERQQQAAEAQAAAERTMSATLTGLVGALVIVAVGAAVIGVRILRAPEEDAAEPLTK
jgi:hypothetical protein